jgi:hypothetical protein
MIGSEASAAAAARRVRHARPIGYRIATRHPDWILGVIAQNGNAYEAGLGPNMQPAVRYWANRTGMEELIR